MDDSDQFITLLSTVLATSNGSFTYPYLFVAVYGAASGQSTVQCELCINYEAQFESNTLSLGGASDQRNPAIPGWYETAKSMMRSINYETISPFIGSAIDMGLRRYGIPPLASLANGQQAPGRLSGGRLPMLGWTGT
jgi:hypothetical protein